jgi:hypothetical protein
LFMWVTFYTDGVPCHHMVAVVKSSRIEGLTASNAIYQLILMSHVTLTWKQSKLHWKIGL